MSKHLLFELAVDTEQQTVHITKEFAANLDLVWDAWTTAEILDKWWAPKPFLSRTKHMDFKVGGRRFYAMVSPQGEEYWSLQEYVSISPKSNFKMNNAFADKDENPDLPGSKWDINFNAQEDVTIVQVAIYNESRERMEKMIEMGFKEGFKMALQNLDALFLTDKNNQ